VNTVGYGFVTYPMAAAPWKSYRYRGQYGHIAIGAMNDDDALKQARRSVSDPRTPIVADKLDRWDGEQYVPVVTP